MTIGRPWDYPCFRWSYWLGIVSIDPGLKRIIHILWILGCVFPSLLVTKELHIQNTLRPQSSNGTWFVRNEVSLKNCCASNKRLWRRFYRCPKFFKSLICYFIGFRIPCRSHIPVVNRQRSYFQKMPPVFDGSTSWFDFEELIDDLINLTQKEAGKRGPALMNRLVGDASIYKKLLESSISWILWDLTSPKDFRVFLPAMFLFISSKERKHGDGLEGFLDGHVTNDWQIPLFREVKPEDKIRLMLIWPAEVKKDKAEVRNFCSRIYRKQQKSGMPQRWPPTESFFHSLMTWQHLCSLLQVISAKPRENDLREFFLFMWWMLLHTHSKGYR